MRKIVIVLTTMAATTGAAAQSQATGPRAPAANLPTCTPTKSNAPCKSEIGVSLVTNMVRTIAEREVAKANAGLAADGRRARVSLEGLPMWRTPERRPTRFWNRTNTWFVGFSYRLTLKVSIFGPITRRIFLPIDIEVFCNNWHTNNGQVVFHSRPGPANFSEGSFLEGVFNVANYIDSRVRAAFVAPLPVSVELPNSECATIGAANNGTQQGDDDSIVWSVPRPFPGGVVTSSIDVTFDRLKRLNARDFNGGIVYKEIENIRLNLYANYLSSQKELTMREGDDVALNLPAISLDPAKFDTLVVLGSAEQPPDNPKDSAFAVSTRAQNYRPGTHTIRIPKTFSMPPSITNRKPSFVTVPAYELRYTVRCSGCSAGTKNF